ncbi:MAG: hypothetical protein Q4B26_02205 [Eubacteriales bacterium]|nr:hypothetical protein [Eubacteriales bacterium]
MASLYIDGSAMPEPKLNGLAVSREKIWSKNTGRSAAGKMVGDVVATKLNLKIEWAVLSEAQLSKISRAIENAFVSVKFKNPHSGKEETHTMYAGTLSCPVYSYASGMPAYTGVSLTLVEQ